MGETKKKTKLNYDNKQGSKKTETITKNDILNKIKPIKKESD